MWVCCSHDPQFIFHRYISFQTLALFFIQEEFHLSSCIIMYIFVVVPYYVQPPCISAHDNPLVFYIQEPVYISRMIIWISNKHACFPSVVQLGSHLFPFMYGNQCHLSKRSQMLHVLCILIVEQSIW